MHRPAGAWSQRGTRAGRASWACGSRTLKDRASTLNAGTTSRRRGVAGPRPSLRHDDAAGRSNGSSRSCGRSCLCGDTIAGRRSGCGLHRCGGRGRDFNLGSRRRRRNGRGLRCRRDGRCSRLRRSRSFGPDGRRHGNDGRPGNNGPNRGLGSDRRRRRHHNRSLSWLRHNPSWRWSSWSSHRCGRSSRLAGGFAYRARRSSDDRRGPGHNGRCSNGSRWSCCACGARAYYGSGSRSNDGGRPGDSRTCLGSSLSLLALEDRLERVTRLGNVREIERRLRLRGPGLTARAPVFQVIAHPLGLVGLNGAGMRLWLSHANCCQSIQYGPALDFQFPCEIVDSNFAHPSLFSFPALAGHISLTEEENASQLYYP